MTDTDILQAVIQELHRAHGAEMVQGGNDLYESLERALAMLPKDGIEWAVAKPTLAVFARSEDTLFLITLDQEKKTFTLTSRPLKGGDLVVGLEWGEPSTSEERITWRDTMWTFRYVGDTGDMQEWQRIAGRVNTSGNGDEPFDRRERFARGLAKQAGWEPT